MANKNGKACLTKVKNACRNYRMIEEGDRIAVGVSGGKDSSALLFIMHTLKRHLPQPFTLIPIYVDLGFDMDIKPLRQYCDSLGYELIVEKTGIKEIVFDVRDERNPCALCAKLRKGALLGRAKILGANKLALGHHLDDAAETFFMNMIYGGKLGAFPPSIFLDRKEMTMIRPLIYLSESTISSLVQREALPEVKNVCPLDGKTKRDEMKGLVASLESKYPDFKRKFLSSLENVDKVSVWDLWQADTERK